MISLKDAQESGFATSTRAELRKYAEELGIENIPKDTNAAALKKMVFNALGLPMNPEQSGAAHKPVVSTTRGGDTIFPSYNLTPNGIWAGRRHRMSLPRPEGVKIGQAEGYAWNGKHPYYIAYDEVDAVPEPIYQIIITNKRRRPKMVRPEGGELGEVTTGWDFDSMPMSYYGVDEETKNRAGSLMEWYRSRGTEWFNKLDYRQLSQIAGKCEVSMSQFVEPGVPRRQLTENELRGRLLEFFFGYADAFAEPNTAIEA